MIVEKDKVVSIDYEIKDVSQGLIETSDDGPLQYLQGSGSLAPGLEKSLEGKSLGDQIQITLPPEEAFGSLDKELLKEMSLDDFENIEDVKPGMVFHAEEDDFVRAYTVLKVTQDRVSVDGNHPFAGKTLNFSVTIRDIRESTPEERDHGHVHYDGDHHH